MEQKTKKWIAASGIGVVAYHALSMSVSQLPQIAILTTQYNGISLLTVAAGTAVYGIYMLWTY